MNQQDKNSVLIVDDEKLNIIALTHILHKEYSVHAVIDSREAVEVAEEDMPDVILLDVLMPEMDGYAVIAALKKSEKARDIPVIFITGLDSIDSEEKGLALGAADYITRPFSPAIVKLRIRNQIKILNQFRIIERISMFDQLTNLPNRRSFEGRLHAEWGRALREQAPISIFMIDVDKFKNYNDVHGHQQGDVALQSVSEIFCQTLKRPGDFVARWGGEEFIALLANTNLVGALEVAERVRRSVECMEIPGPCSLTTKITVSIGVNTRTQGDSGTFDTLIAGADAALYDAKRKGRNRVCYFKKNPKN